MDVLVSPSVLTGTVRVPSSKSHFIRAVAAAMLCRGRSAIVHPSACDDAVAMLNVACAWGANVTVEDDSIHIEGTPVFEGEGIFDCGESALAARMMLAIGALRNGKVTVTGKGTLLKRNLGDVAGVLKQLGVRVENEGNTLPVRVQGPMAGGKVVADGSHSSQFVSGLLMALPLAKSDSVLVVKNLKSRPYVDLTLDVLHAFGIKTEVTDGDVFYIKGGQAYRQTTINTEGDWSGGAFLLVAAAIKGIRLRIEGLDVASKQADKAVLVALNRAGARIEHTEGAIIIGASHLNGFHFDATHSPDLFPPLAVLAAYCNGKSVIKGVGRLKHKESDRAEALVTELSKLGVKIAIDGDEMMIIGSEVTGGTVSSHHDHRLAMAAAVAALGAGDDVLIKDAGCVSKSWPGFFDRLRALGTPVEIQ
jgi:3-phosphoshikimate 1-carboxyvinyltransferase